MKRQTISISSIIIAICILTITLSGCTNDDQSKNEFQNELTLGTNLNAANLFELTGTGTTFSPGTLFFRLESADDMAGSLVSIRITSESTDTTMTFSNPQSYGHIFLSSFTLSKTGNYTATGGLVTGNKTIASINFTIL